MSVGPRLTGTAPRGVTRPGCRQAPPREALKHPPRGGARSSRQHAALQPHACQQWDLPGPSAAPAPRQWPSFPCRGSISSSSRAGQRRQAAGDRPLMGRWWSGKRREGDLPSSKEQELPARGGSGGGGGVNPATVKALSTFVDENHDDDSNPHPTGAVTDASSDDIDLLTGFNDSHDCITGSIGETADMVASEKRKGGGSAQGPVTTTATGRAVFEVLRVDPKGRQRRLFVKRRDLLRAHQLQPRDLRRIDPSLAVGKSIYSIAVRDGCMLMALGGVRLIVADDRALLFEPNSSRAKQFLDIAVAHLESSEGGGGSAPVLVGAAAAVANQMVRRSIGESSMTMDEDGAAKAAEGPPFELEMVEAALIVATGALDVELAAIEERVQKVLSKLPKHINPVNLEELRSVKASLVDIESKADTLREVLEDLMDDEDEMREMNLSSRPQREERRRQRERDRLEREREYEREREARRERALAEEADPEGLNAVLAAREDRTESGSGVEGEALDMGSLMRESAMEKWWEEEKMREAFGNYGADVEEAMVVAEEAEEEERELQQVEDMLDYYLSRAAMAEDEAQQMLSGARDLEESIGVSLSARRLEVNRLELTLSIGSFAAALGAMIAGIFGMNLRSTLENSVVGFWLTSAGIVLGCSWVFFLLFQFAKRKSIL